MTMNKTARMIPTLIAALLTVLTLAGCDNDDIDQAYDLNGYWQGSIDGNYYYDRATEATKAGTRRYGSCKTATSATADTAVR